MASGKLIIQSAVESSAVESGQTHVQADGIWSALTRHCPRITATCGKQPFPTALVCLVQQQASRPGIVLHDHQHPISRKNVFGVVARLADWWRGKLGLRRSQTRVGRNDEGALRCRRASRAAGWLCRDESL